MTFRPSGPTWLAGLGLAALAAACAEGPTAARESESALTPSATPSLGYVLPYGCKDYVCVGTGTGAEAGDGLIRYEELQVCKQYPAGVVGDPVTIAISVKTTAANLAAVARDGNKWSPPSFSVVLQPNSCLKVWRNGTLFGPDADTLTVTEIVDASKWVATSQLTTAPRQFDAQGRPLPANGVITVHPASTATTHVVSLGGPTGDGALIVYTNTPVPPANYTVGDFVWNDVDGDGTQDAGEAGLAGIGLSITGPGGYSASTTTDGAGGYTFPGLAAGQYTVCVTSGIAAGFAPTFDLDGTSSAGCATFTVSASRTDVDFGYTPPRFSIGDFVWNDMDGDGVQDAGEPGIDGATVTLTNLATSATTTATTSGGGSFTFPNLLAGTYQVCVSGTPAGFIQTYDLDGLGTAHCATVTLSASRTDVDFGYRAQPANGSGQGCTPGYWKQKQHFDSWKVYAQADMVDAVFGVTFRSTHKANPSGALNLLEALGLNGNGGGEQLFRHGTAALLNSVSTSGVSYPYSTAEVIAMVSAAWNSGDGAKIAAAHAALAAANEQGCPLN